MRSPLEEIERRKAFFETEKAILLILDKLNIEVNHVDNDNVFLPNVDNYIYALDTIDKINKIGICAMSSYYISYFDQLVVTHECLVYNVPFNLCVTCDDYEKSLNLVSEGNCTIVYGQRTETEKRIICNKGE